MKYFNNPKTPLMKNCTSCASFDGNTTALSIERNVTMYLNWIKYTLCLLISLACINQLNAQASYCTMICNDQITVSLGSNCGAEITYDLMLSNWDSNTNCSPSEAQDFDVWITYPTNTNILTPPNQIDESHLGSNLQCIVKHNDTGNICWGNIWVEDTSAPIINAPQDVVVNCGVAIPTTIIRANNIIDCSTTTQTYTDEVIELGCSGTYSSQIVRTHQVIDALGNISTSEQNLFVQRNTLNDIQTPHNYDGNDLPILSCGSPYDVSVIPGPLLNGHEITDGGFCNISITHNDQEVELCGGGKEIYRVWTMLDLCQGASGVIVQNIIVKDETPPVIICPTAVNFGTNSQDCNGNIVFPPATVEDNCSSSIDVVISTAVGSIAGNGGFIGEIPYGSQTVLYTATDDCDNTSSCSLTIEVNDRTLPIPVCDQNTVVGLSNSNDGNTLICKQVFDDGSYDNCGAVETKIKRVDAPVTAAFGNCILLECEDVGTEVMVILRVEDTSGNSNQCMLAVEVQDTGAPTITCPEEIFIECEQDAMDLAITNKAVGSDNCGSSITFTDVQNTIDDCGIGLLKRRWRAEDIHGNFSTCDQNIIVQNSTPFDGESIIWPMDPPALSCMDVGTLDPEDLEVAYGVPIFTTGGCNQVFESYEDEIYYVANSACFEIRREWKVVDWCQFHPNNVTPTGIWYHTQTISVIDAEAPVIDGPDDIIIAATDNSCTTTFVNIPELTATDCNPDIEITNNSPYAIANFADASGVYPYGDTRVEFAASDGCGNITLHEIIVKITDGKAPTPVCLSLTTNLMSNGTVELSAIDLEAGSSADNCTAFEDLTFRARVIENGVFSTTPPVSSSITLNCAHIGLVDVQLWAGDESGNWDYCLSTIVVTDNMSACTGPLSNEYNISGQVTNEEMDEVENVEMNISNGSIESFMTGTDGSYMFPNLEGGTNYTVTAEKDSDYGNGVTTFDLIIMQKHILGIELLESPYKIIAADVNQSETISTVDIVEVRRLILNQITEFATNTSWRFVDRDYVFIDPTDPFLGTFPEVFSLNSLTTDEPAADFVAIKIGDLNCSASTSGRVENVATRNNETLDMKLNIKEMEGNQVMVSFSANEFKDILGYQFALSFDTESLSFVEMVDGALPNLTANNFGFSFLNDGIITTSWSTSTSHGMEDGEVLFSLVFDKLKKDLPNNLFDLKSNPLNAEAYRQGATAITPMDINISIDNNNTNTDLSSASYFQVFQNKPNPFSNETVIGFDLPDASSVFIKIYDVSGKVLSLTNSDFEAGYHEVSVRKDEIDATGVIYYQVDTATDTATNKMIILK